MANIELFIKMINISGSVSLSCKRDCKFCLRYYNINNQMYLMDDINEAVKS